MPARALRHHRFETLEPVEVEIVGGLVEEGDVEAGQHDGGQRHPGRLTPGQGGRLLVDDAGRKTEVGQGAGDPGVDVTGRQPVVAFEGQGETVVGAAVAAPQSLTGVGQLGFGAGPRRSGG